MKSCRRRMPALLSWGLALTTVAAVYAQPQPDAAPTLACSVLDGNGTPPPEQPLRVSNLKRVLMRATLHAPAGAVDGLRLAGAKGTAEGGPPGNLEIVARRRTEAARPRMETKAAVVGHGAEPGRQYLDISLEIPVPASVRRANIEKYLAWLQQESSKAKKGEEFTRLAQDRAAAVAAFERMYMEHVVGEFAITCAYAARRPGTWTGEIVSPPVHLQVYFESSFFDQPAFR